jgi:hypothetical protein
MEGPVTTNHQRCHGGAVIVGDRSAAATPSLHVSIVQ